MSGYKTFAVVGAGTIGGPVISELLKLKATGTISSVSLITRSSTHPLSSSGVQILTVSYTDPSSLTRALSGIDVLISTVATAGLVHQPALAQAAKEAGVKLFVPPEFGMPSDVDVPGVLGAKYRFKQELKKLGLPYTAICSGIFTGFIFNVPPFGWDVKNGKATIFGDGDAQNSWTDAPDVARYVAHVLTHVPREKLEWQTLRIQGDLASMNDILTAYQTHTGTQLSVTRVSTAELKARVDKNPADFAWLLLLYNEGYANVEKAGVMAMELFPEWNPRKVVDVLAGMAG
ncbi:NAD-P-binding protein [Trametopsis cervina]|nr:NAD-P-binding protein [Trametopsis cervina]